MVMVVACVGERQLGDIGGVGNEAFAGILEGPWVDACYKASEADL